MEADTEVRPIQVNLKCPDCEIILNMKHCPRPRPNNPDQIQKYKYWCSRCGTEIILEKEYPYIKYVPK